MSIPYRRFFAEHLLAAAAKRAKKPLVALRRRKWKHLCKTADAAAEQAVARLGGGQIRIRINTNPLDVISERIFTHGFFEEPECRFVMRFLQSGMTVIDIGANIGQYTLIAADIVGGHGHVHSFEPNPANFSELALNVAMNDLQSRCTLIDSAVSDSIGTARLSLHPPGLNVYSTIGNQERAAVLGHKVVATETIDNYVINTHHCKSVDFIKIDTEGAELQVLHGARRLLNSDMAPVILMELSASNAAGCGYCAYEILDYLERFSYVFYEIDHNGLVFPFRKNYHQNNPEVNIAAIPPNRR